MSTSGPKERGKIPDGYKLTNEVTYNILHLEKASRFITTLTNTHTPEVVNATIRKTWNDSDNSKMASARPRIKVDLKKNDRLFRP